MPDALTPVLDAAILLPLLIVLVRLAGLRSFAKMSAHDFVVTVATGSVVAATVLNPGTPWWQGAVAVTALLGAQAALGWARMAVPGLQRAMDNEPMALLRDGSVDAAALARARMTEDDLRQKLRQAGVRSSDAVALVVMETTGDVSVLAEAPAAGLVADVRGAAGG